MASGMSSSLFNEQERITVHRLRVFRENLNGKTDLADGCKNIDRHGFGGGPGRSRVFARSPGFRAVVTEITTVATQEKCLVIARQEERPLQFQQFLVNPSCPGMPVFGLGHCMGKTEDRH